MFDFQNVFEKLKNRPFTPNQIIQKWVFHWSLCDGFFLTKIYCLCPLQKHCFSLFLSLPDWSNPPPNTSLTMQLWVPTRSQKTNGAPRHKTSHRQQHKSRFQFTFWIWRSLFDVLKLLQRSRDEYPDTVNGFCDCLPVNTHSIQFKSNHRLKEVPAEDQSIDFVSQKWIPPLNSEY